MTGRPDTGDRDDGWAGAKSEPTFERDERLWLEGYLERLRNTPGGLLDRLVVYGWKARDDAGPANEVDVLVLVGGPRTPYGTRRSLPTAATTPTTSATTSWSGTGTADPGCSLAVVRASTSRLPGLSAGPNPRYVRRVPRPLSISCRDSPAEPASPRRRLPQHCGPYSRSRTRTPPLSVWRFLRIRAAFRPARPRPFTTAGGRPARASRTRASPRPASTPRAFPAPPFGRGRVSRGVRNRLPDPPGLLHVRPRRPAQLCPAGDARAVNELRRRGRDPAAVRALLHPHEPVDGGEAHIVDRRRAGDLGGRYAAGPKGHGASMMPSAYAGPNRSLIRWKSIADPAETDH